MPSYTNHETKNKREESRSHHRKVAVGKNAVEVIVRIRPSCSNKGASSSRCVELHYDDLLRKVSSPQNGFDMTTSQSPSIENSDCTIQFGGKDGASFKFNHVLDESSKQLQIYRDHISPLVHICVGGRNASIIAYGQTGSGKTHTIMGKSGDNMLHALEESTDEVLHSTIDSDSSGILPRALLDLFCELKKLKQQSINETRQASLYSFEYEIRVQFLELYGEEIRDLICSDMQRTRLTIRDGKEGEEPEVIGACRRKVNSAKEALSLLKEGTIRRVTGPTEMNANSSRSHAIFTVLIKQTKTPIGNEMSENNAVIETTKSKFHFVDLAGSERQKRSMTKGKRMQEGISINQGLLVLGNVISALGDAKKRGKAFVPYRDSKLTRMLKGSLGGDHKTTMIACISPSMPDMEESISTLRYATRARNIQNKDILKVETKSTILVDLKSNVIALAKEVLRMKDKYYAQTEGPYEISFLQYLASGGIPIPQERMPPPSLDSYVGVSSSTLSYAGNSTKSFPDGDSIASSAQTHIQTHGEVSKELMSAHERLSQSDTKLVILKDSIRSLKDENRSLCEKLKMVGSGETSAQSSDSTHDKNQRRFSNHRKKYSTNHSSSFAHKNKETELQILMTQFKKKSSEASDLREKNVALGQENSAVLMKHEKAQIRLEKELESVVTEKKKLEEDLEVSTIDLKESRDAGVQMKEEIELIEMTLDTFLESRGNGQSLIASLPLNQNNTIDAYALEEEMSYGTPDQLSTKMIRTWSGKGNVNEETKCEIEDDDSIPRQLLEFKNTIMSLKHDIGSKYSHGDHKKRDVSKGYINKESSSSYFNTEIVDVLLKQLKLFQSKLQNAELQTSMYKKKCKALEIGYNGSPNTQCTFQEANDNAQDDAHAANEELTKAKIALDKKSEEISILKQRCEEEEIKTKVITDNLDAALSQRSAKLAEAKANLLASERHILSLHESLQQDQEKGRKKEKDRYQESTHLNKRISELEGLVDRESKKICPTCAIRVPAFEREILNLKEALRSAVKTSLSPQHKPKKVSGIFKRIR
eukprot:CAMPEP_0194374684 /NCGR_PEP_ID=MMETSP0174-20130528/23126_1 /TAXON_ID=216777 /ORGANISM="Proboscia alata, Strain PI-D3" /LENGTH=1045 /DNA_ID=CAMNT_0039154407 /DNA_START=41 /DNA_END=3178 /DNA_ORIENTATION=-